MAAVTGDLGTWDDPTEFLSGPEYLNHPRIRFWLYRLFIPVINRRIQRLRVGEHAPHPSEVWGIE